MRWRDNIKSDFWSTKNWWKTISILIIYSKVQTAEKKKCRSRYPSEIEMYKDVIRYIGSQKDELDYFRTIIFRS